MDADVTKCAFWEYDPDTLQGHWATHGCTREQVNSTATTCSCNHLTHFAILMSSGRANVSRETLGRGMGVSGSYSRLRLKDLGK